MRALVEIAADYARIRVQFGHPIGSYQAVQHALTDMFSAADAAEMLALQCLANDGTRREAALAFVRESAWRSVMSAYDVLGGVGFVEDHPISSYTRGITSLLGHVGTAAECDARAGRVVTSRHWLA
jgi:alkylation response protein AidB-like acyl-CoA dehydrogenase